MLQVVCGCGRIAEVRHSKVGKKLAYTHCSNCGASARNTRKAELIEAEAREDIGIKGEFLEKASATEQPSQESKVENWKPEPEEMPEIVEPDIETEQKAESPQVLENSGGGLNKVKIVAGVVITGLLGFTAYKFNQG